MARGLCYVCGVYVISGLYLACELLPKRRNLACLIRQTVTKLCHRSRRPGAVFRKFAPSVGFSSLPQTVVLNALAAWSPVPNSDHKDTMEYLAQLFRDKHLHLSADVLQFHLQMKLAAVWQEKLSIFHSGTKLWDPRSTRSWIFELLASWVRQCRAGPAKQCASIFASFS